MNSQEQHTEEQYENATSEQTKQTPSEYLQSVIDLIRENALNSTKIDWEKTTADAMGFCEFAVSTADTYPIIRDLLEKLEDNHSHFKTPQKYKKDKYSTVEENAPMTRKMLESNIAYLNVPYVRGYTDEKNLLYATIIQDHIAALDSLDPVGWIVDLRQNTGGNMWPMLAGLGPLLGEGIHGYMVMNDGDYPWIYRNGSIGMEDFSLITLPDSGYKLSNPDLPVAVLIGSQTMSSGEAVTISFIGKENVKFFGRPTQGLSTVNVSHKLSDGAQIVLTEGIFADSSGKQYGGKIKPDVFVEDKEKTIEKAVEWILDINFHQDNLRN
jgi:C-terminal processing protease CtpA/Prc